MSYICLLFKRNKCHNISNDQRSPVVSAYRASAGSYNLGRWIECCRWRVEFLFLFIFLNLFVSFLSRNKQKKQKHHFQTMFSCSQWKSYDIDLFKSSVIRDFHFGWKSLLLLLCFFLLLLFFFFFLFTQCL